MNAAISNERAALSRVTLFPARDYDLAATLDSGQVFRWQRSADGSSAGSDSWTGVIGRHAVRLTRTGDGIRAETTEPMDDWQWLRDYLQTDVDLEAVLKTFPDDAPMRDAVVACRGLRVLRQDPWECLASFILSSTKQIVQIRQIIELLCERYGEPIGAAQVGRAVPCAPSGARHSGAHGVTRPTRLAERDGFFSFPTPQRLANTTEAELRACKMGFRAPHLLAAARQIAEGKFELERPRFLPLAEGELAALSDMIVATPKARFSQPEIKLGVFPPLAAVILPHVIGHKRAIEMILTGEPLDAEEARRLGLVNRVVPEANLDQEVEKLVAKITEQSAPVLEMAKKSLYETIGLSIPDAIKRSSNIYLNQLMYLDDAQEGLRAMVEKRKPVWKNK